jgi:LPS export ABC transporter protein LptC
MQKILSFIIVLLFSLAGCSLEYKEGAESDELADTVPDAVLNQFVHTAVKGDKLVFQIEAAQAKLFQKQKVTVLTNVRFVDYDDSGAVTLEGRAGSALYHTDTENAEMSGAIYGYSTQDKVAFYARTLTWNKEQRLLQSRSGDTVRIEKDDGTYIEGTFFTVDARRKTLSYDGAVRGKFVREEKDEKEKH